LNDNINFPTGTPRYPDLETYFEKVGLEMYDIFFILNDNRFTESDRLLAEKVKSLNKSFFFIRTKIDRDCRSESRKRKEKPFDEQAMLQAIREKCLEDLKGSEVGDNAVFLISNHQPAKWDFDRLRQAILDVLPNDQRECLTLSDRISQVNLGGKCEKRTRFFHQAGIMQIVFLLLVPRLLLLLKVDK
jgi:hypothetical protein